MIAEKQIKNDKNNIYNILKYFLNIENINNMIMFIYDKKEIELTRKIFEIDIEYHELIKSKKFIIWDLLNCTKIKNKLIYINVKELNKSIIRNIKIIKKQVNFIVVNFDKKISLKEVRKIFPGAVSGYINYDTNKNVVMLLGKKLEYKKCANKKVLAIMHVYNEEDAIKETIEHLLKEGIDVFILENWSTDRTYEIVEKMQKNIGGVESY